MIRARIRMFLLIVTTKSDKAEKALYKGLARSGIRIDLICQPDDPDIPELIGAGIDVSTLSIRHRLDLKAIRFIRDKLNSRRFDIIYAPRNNCLSASLIASLGKDIKIVGYRGTSGHITRVNPGDWLTYLNPRVDRIICVSESVRRYLITFGLPPHRLVAIYKGHDASWYETAKKPSPIFPDIPSNAFIVGFVGNMRPIKGIEILMRSFQYLPDTTDIYFILIGEIRYSSLFLMSIKPEKSDHIRFIGYREDAADLMKHFSVLVMPSLDREGFPRAVIEAMAQGIPPIVTDVGGMPEIVRHNANGLVVSPGNPEALAQAIQFFYKNEGTRWRLGQNARKTIVEEFNSSIMIARMIELFNTLIGIDMQRSRKSQKSE